MPCNACRFILVRHGQTPWNEQQRLQGQLLPGPPLDALGLQQAAVLAQRLKEESIDAFYTSDLKRATQTAAVIAAAIERQPVLSPLLRERNLASIQGLTYEEARVQQPEAYAALMSHESTEKIPGGGESAADLYQRAEAALEGIAQRHPGQQVLVVSHGGFLHAAYRRANAGEALGKGFGDQNINGALNFVSIAPSKRPGEPAHWEIVRWNEAAHLESVGFLESAFGGGAESG